MRLLRELAACLSAVALSVALVVGSGCERRESLLPPGKPTTKISPTPKPGPAQPEASAPHAQDAPPPPSTGARGIPREALRYRAELTRNARAVWGLDAPVAACAAQIHQESGWRATASSPVGARGMAQFMPATAAWISKAYPGELGENAPMNPSWAIRALVTYDRYLWDRIAAASDCHRFAFSLSAYNGGLGWVQRDRALAANKGLPPGEWWDSVETVNAGRSPANHKENRGYPKRILRTLTPLYVADGWGKGACQ